MEMLLKKLTSARFLIAVSISGTFCYLSIIGKIPIEAFMTIMVVVIKDYYERKDRTNGKETINNT